MNTITPGHVYAYELVRSAPPDLIRLSSCTINGEPGVAIVAMNQLDARRIEVMPLFVAITPGMEIDFPGQGDAEEGGGGPKDPRDAYAAAQREATRLAPA